MNTNSREILGDVLILVKTPKKAAEPAVKKAVPAKRAKTSKEAAPAKEATKFSAKMAGESKPQKATRSRLLKCGNSE